MKDKKMIKPDKKYRTKERIDIMKRKSDQYTEINSHALPIKTNVQVMFSEMT